MKENDLQNELDDLDNVLLPNWIGLESINEFSNELSADGRFPFPLHVLSEEKNEKDLRR